MNGHPQARPPDAPSARTAALLAAALLALVSCKPPWPEWGALSIQIAESNAKTIVPGIDMTIAEYEVSGRGPGGMHFSRSTAAPTVTVMCLAFGDWTIAVDGKNAVGTIIAHGEAPVKVLTGATQPVSIAVAPVWGPGALALTVSWTAAAVSSPSLQSQLIPSQGMPTELAFSISSPGKATSATSGIPSGYHTLVVKLLDNGQLVMGGVDVVRIVKDQTTSGAFTFTDINTGTGSISVSVTPRMDNPITVTMSGQKAELGAGTPMTVTASAPPDVGNVTFVWYLNGQAKSTGPSFTLNEAANPLAAGFYRLDVTAFTAAGARGGSTACTFRVSSVRQVTLEWDPNTESNLAGYRLYVGIASGVYDRSIEAGLVTTCTVPGLLSGQTYYFAATTYNTSGAESAKSNEVMYTVP
jgi:hypothetical protein